MRLQCYQTVKGNNTTVNMTILVQDSKRDNTSTRIVNETIFLQDSSRDNTSIRIVNVTILLQV